MCLLVLTTQSFGTLRMKTPVCQKRGKQPTWGKGEPETISLAVPLPHRLCGEIWSNLRMHWSCWIFPLCLLCFCSLQGCKSGSSSSLMFQWLHQVVSTCQMFGCRTGWFRVLGCEVVIRSKPQSKLKLGMAAGSGSNRLPVHYCGKNISCCHCCSCRFKVLQGSKCHVHGPGPELLFMSDHLCLILLPFTFFWLLLNPSLSSCAGM